MDIGIEDGAMGQWYVEEGLPVDVIGLFLGERLFSAFSGEIFWVRPDSVRVGPAQVRLLLQFFYFILKRFKNSIRTNLKVEQILSWNKFKN
jgi:hypothetical protein